MVGPVSIVTPWKHDKLVQTSRSAPKFVRTFFFVITIIFIVVLHTNVDRTEVGPDKSPKANTEVSLDGVECLYSMTVDKHVKVWEPFSVNIFYAPSSENCSVMFQGRLNRNGGSVFRVQAFSMYEMVTATAEHTINEVYKASLLLTFPTKYVVIAMVTYVNGDAMEARKHVRPILRQLPRSPVEVNVVRAPVPSHLNRYCTQSESGSAHGRWIKCGGAVPGLERCGPWQGPEFDFDRLHGYRWVPYRCQYHQYTNDELKRCLARNKWDNIIFVGDSHMRYRAYHWATRLYGSCHACAKTHIKMVFDKVPRIEWVFDARGTRLPLAFPNISMPYEKYVHPNVRRSKFSWPFPSEALDGNLFLFNFGHWLLRESGDIEFMRDKLRSFAQSAIQLQRMGKTVLWINAYSLPWRTDQSVIDWRENTSPYRVLKFNRIADSIMREYDIPVIDSFQISDGRIAATHDQTHYAKRLPGNDFGGAVENAVTNAIINKLCNKPD